MEKELTEFIIFEKIIQLKYAELDMAKRFYSLERSAGIIMPEYIKTLGRYRLNTKDGERIE